MQMNRRKFIGGVAAASVMGIAGCSTRSEEQSIEGMQTFRPFSYDAPNLHIFLVDGEGRPSLGGILSGEEVTNVVVTKDGVDATLANFEVVFEKDNFVANLNPQYAPYDEISGRYYVHSVAGGSDPVANPAETVPVEIENGSMSMLRDQAKQTDADESPY